MTGGWGECRFVRWLPAVEIAVLDAFDEGLPRRLVERGFRARRILRVADEVLLLLLRARVDRGHLDARAARAAGTSLPHDRWTVFEHRCLLNEVVRPH